MPQWNIFYQLKDLMGPYSEDSVEPVSTYYVNILKENLLSQG